MAEARVDHPKDGDKKDEGLPSDCPACGHPVSTSWCGFCGFCGFLVSTDSAATPDWPAPGTQLGEGDQSLILKAVLGSEMPEDEGRRYEASDEDGNRYEVVMSAPGSGQALRRRRTEARALLGDAALSPSWVTEWRDCKCVVTRLPKGAILADGLNACLEAVTPPPMEQMIQQWVNPLVTFLARMHEQGLFLGEMDPGEILIRSDGGCVLRDPAPPLDISDIPHPLGVRRVCEGFAAPELAGHCTGVLTPATDVFFAGMVLYYLVSGISPMDETTWPGDRMPNPHIYQLDAPPDLVAVVRKATSPIPARRYPDAVALRDALAWALRQGEQREAVPFRRLKLDIGHELHIGVLKGQYNAQNQDDMFLAWDHLSGVGLFVVADGVSISEYGTGDLASACVREEAFNLWGRLRAGEVATPGAADREMPPSIPNLFEPKGSGRAGLSLKGPSRRALMRRMLDRANARIGERIHEDMPTFPAQPVGIMASTTVAALVDGNAVTLMSIGDSRIYLIRDGHIISLMADHDLATQLLRFGRVPSTVRQVAAGGSLVRCVGEFEKNDRDQLVPVPLQPDFRELRVQPGDTLVLCSDGIPDYAGFDEEDAEDRMRRVIESAPGAPWGAFELMVLANRGGGGDNISCVVLSFGAPLAMGDATPLSVKGGGR